MQCAVGLAGVSKIWLAEETVPHAIRPLELYYTLQVGSGIDDDIKLRQGQNILLDLLKVELNLSRL